MRDENVGKVVMDYFDSCIYFEFVIALLTLAASMKDRTRKGINF